MGELILTCSCGRQKRISVYAVGIVETCEGCGRRVQSSEENTSTPPVEQLVTPSPVLAPEASRPPKTDPPNVCPQCGKAFRGDWDRVEVAHGIVCHHCSVLATESMPDLQHVHEPSDLPIEKAPNLESPPKMNSLGP